MNEARHRRLSSLTLALALLCGAAGCATAVADADRDRLWNAAVLAAGDAGYAVTDADASRGYLFGAKVEAGKDGATSYRLEVRLRQAAQQYEAVVIVRGTAEPVRYALVEAPLATGRQERDSDNRAVSEFGTAAARVPGEEEVVRGYLRGRLR